MEPLTAERIKELKKLIPCNEAARCSCKMCTYWMPLCLAAEREVRMREALESLTAFVGVMIGRGPESVIPESIDTPLGVSVKIGAIMRDARAALAPREPEVGR